MNKTKLIMTRFRLSAADVEGKPDFDFTHEMIVTESEVPRDFDLNLSHVLISSLDARSSPGGSTMRWSSFERELLRRMAQFDRETRDFT